MNDEIKKVLFIVNKFSGTGYRAEVEGRIIDICEENDWECSIEFTRRRGHATELARKAAVDQAFSRVVAVGGDGTVNEVAQGLLYSKVAMGIVPKGSGNGLARHLNIPLRLSAAVRNLFTSHEMNIDSFTLNGKLSLNVSGIGFDGHIANLFGAEKKRGLNGYIKHTVTGFFRFREFEAEILSPELSKNQKAFIIAIANSSQYGNNARIAPAASVCDGLLHISVLKKVPIYRLDFFFSFFSGKVNHSSFCQMFETNELTIRTKSPVAFHVDGEACGRAEVFQIELLPGSLRMLVPKAAKKP